MDLSQLMQMAGQLKDQLGDAQEAAAKLEASGEAGGGLVKLTLNGQHRMTALHIDPSLLVAGQGTLLEDLIIAATNQASGTLAGAVKDKMGGLAEGLGIDAATLAGLGG